MASPLIGLAQSVRAKSNKMTSSMMVSWRPHSPDEGSMLVRLGVKPRLISFNELIEYVSFNFT
jgi:hypothetical protein